MSIVRIHAPGPSGMGTVTRVDGDEVLGIRDIKLHIGIDEPNEVVIQKLVLAWEGDIEVEADVLWAVELLNIPKGTSTHLAKGPTIPVALRRLADDIEREQP